MGLLTAAAAVVGTVAAGAIGANKQASAAKKAANAQVQASEQANATQLQIYNDQKRLLTPSALSGAEAAAKRRLMTGTSVADANKGIADTYAAYGQTGAPTIDSFDPTEFIRSTPGYEFNRSQGEETLQRSAAASGNLFSGRTGIALTEYGQDYADNEWDDLYGQLGEIAGEGTDATGTTVNVAGNYGNAVSANQMRAGDARASGYRAAGEAQSNFWNNTVPGAIGAGYGIGRQAGWFGK